MLRKEAISTALSHVLNRLMGMESLSNHRLVGGTALAMQIGHRISVDINLFSGKQSDYTAIEKQIRYGFGEEAKLLHYTSNLPWERNFPIHFGHKNGYTGLVKILSFSG